MRKLLFYCVGIKRYNSTRMLGLTWPNRKHTQFHCLVSNYCLRNKFLTFTGVHAVVTHGIVNRCSVTVAAHCRRGLITFSVSGSSTIALFRAIIPSTPRTPVSISFWNKTAPVLITGKLYYKLYYTHSVYQSVR